MSTAALADQNKAIARRFVEELWSKGNLAVADELLAANYIDHDPSIPDLGPGIEGYKKIVTFYRTAFPDLTFTVEDLIAEGDKVAMRWTSRGTHKGELQGVAATGKQIALTGIVISRIVGGKIEESWSNWDALGLMQQIGAVEPMQ